MRQTAGSEFLIGMASLAITIGFLFFLYLVLDGVHERSCPQGTFLYGPTNLGGALTFLPWMFAGLLAVGTILRGIAYGFSIAEQPYYVAGSIGTSALALMLSCYGAGAVFCSWPQGLSLKDSTFSVARGYLWSDVRRIKTFCASRSAPRFDLMMSDGSDINLADSSRAFIRNFPSVETALRAVPFIYDNSGVAGGCTSDMKQLLLLGPGKGAATPGDR
jgi:hypothetical protein